jgi:16S rRNA (guanine966-N2)-methyltransferase
MGAPAWGSLRGVRVIGGHARGRALHAPDLPGLRPTSDRVREAIFDILYSRGGVEGRSVLDLFAGSGALGIEALSRGAARAVFVEADRRAALAIEQNLAGTRDPDHDQQAEVLRTDAESYLRRRPEHFDVAFCDPPYDYAGWEDLLGLLDAAILVLESSRELPTNDRYEVAKVYRYGGTLVTLAEWRPSAAVKGEA